MHESETIYEEYCHAVAGGMDIEHAAYCAAECTRRARRRRGPQYGPARVGGTARETPDHGPSERPHPRSDTSRVTCPRRSRPRSPREAAHDETRTQ